jgi:hypothetical protein
VNVSAPTIDQLAGDFAKAIESIDERGPVWSSVRTGKKYQPGLGPHPETAVVDLVAHELAREAPDVYGNFGLGVPYPSSPRLKCDWVLGEPPVLAIEVKMLRLMGDNGRPNDNMLMHNMSPYPQHRSALTDGPKLLSSGFSSRLALLIYGFDYPDLPMDPAIEAFELLASQRIGISEMASASFSGLVHPVHREGRVFAWGITSLPAVS